jgi:hypothetical protein
MSLARWLPVLITTGALATWTSSSWAQVAAKQQYIAPEECPTDWDFWATVASRLELPGQAPSPEPVAAAESLSIRITYDGAQYRAAMNLIVGERRVERAVSGETCEATASAVGLVVALALDALHREESAPAREAAPVKPQDSMPRRAPSPDAEGGQAVPTPPARFSLALEGVAAGALAPDIALGGGARLAVASADRSSELGLSLGTRGVTAANAGHTFRADLYSARLEPCPVVARIAQTVLLGACAQLEFGLYRASAREGFARSAPTTSEFWVAGGLSVRLQWRLHRRWALEIAPAAQFPFLSDLALEADRAAGEDAITLHEVPTASAWAGFAVRWDLN